MASPYRRSQAHTSPKYTQEYSDAGVASVNRSNKRGHHNGSYYASPQRDHNDTQDNVLDISKIDHEAIKNDAELKGLSRNPGAFNTHVYEDDEAYYDEEDSDEDMFAEEERLFNNPAEEEKLRRLLSQASSMSNQNVPRTPSLSFHSTTENYDTVNTSSWKDSISLFFYRLVRVCMFQLFMIYWIFKEPVIRTVTFVTMIVSYLFVDPIIFVWSQLPKSRRWVPGSERRQQIAYVCTLIMFLLALVPLKGYVQEFTPLLFKQSNSTNTIDFKRINNENNKLWAGLQDIKSKIDQRIDNEESKFWAGLQDIKSKIDQRIDNEESKFWAGLQDIKSRIDEKIDNENNKLWAELQDIKSKINQKGEMMQDKELEGIWSLLREHQSILEQHKRLLSQHDIEITTMKSTLDDTIRHTLENQLPKAILVHTNENGELEISPQFYAYLKDAQFLQGFMEHNDKTIKKFLTGEMEQFFKQQKQQGAVIDKETFMKLLSKTLLKQQHGNDVDISFEDLINNALEKYHQDVLNEADFALLSRGARIIYAMTSATYSPTPAWIQGLKYLAGFPIPANTPETALSPSTYPGECWQMYGTNGQITIILSEPIVIQSITVEYPSPEIMLGQMNAAPQTMELYGLSSYPKDVTERISLGKFDYNIQHKSSIQTFDISSTSPYQAVAVKIRSNWGNPDHTDLYRIRVHGVPVGKA